MAALTTNDRAIVRASISADLSRAYEGCAVNKIDMQAAVNAIDDFLVANAAAINNALPAAAKANLTSSQKARLLCAVITRRYITGA